jgi:hypothetical protein
MLWRRGLPLAVASVELDRSARLLDLDDPAVLVERDLRPSHVATRDRSITQPQARSVYDTTPAVDGLRWWSTYEATWMNVTLFDRAGSRLRVASVQAVSLADGLVREAAEFLGLPAAPAAR